MAFLKTDTVKPLPETFIRQEGNNLHLKFELVNNFNDYFTSHETKKYKINGEIEFQIRVISVVVTKNTNANNLGYYGSPTPQERTFMNTFYVRGLNVSKTSLHTKFKLTSVQLQTNDRSLDISNDLTWRLIALGNHGQSSFYIELKVVLEEITTPTTSFASLYEDTNITDFELRGDNGSVSVHRAVLAASSPVLRTMLEGTWKETKDGGVKIPNTTRATLQLFKQYLYLNILPVEGLENLLLLASCYMIDDLEEKCMRSLVNTLTPKNVLLRTQFAVQNGITELHVMILERVQAGDINVQEVRRNLDNNK